MAWTDGDFKLFATGLAIGGQWNLGEVKASDVATCYYDAGQFDHFYIKFKKEISEFSFGQFQETITLIGKNGVIKPNDAKKHSSTEMIVYASLLDENDGVLVVGRENGYLTYFTKQLIPKFVSVLTIREFSNIVKLAYIWDKVMICDQYKSAENTTITFSAQQGFSISDEVSMVAYQMQSGETVELSYFKT